MLDELRKYIPNVKQIYWHHGCYEIEYQHRNGIIHIPDMPWEEFLREVKIESQPNI